LRQNGSGPGCEAAPSLCGPPGLGGAARSSRVYSGGANAGVSQECAPPPRRAAPAAPLCSAARAAPARLEQAARLAAGAFFGLGRAASRRRAGGKRPSETHPRGACHAEPACETDEPGRHCYSGLGLQGPNWCPVLCDASVRALAAGHGEPRASTTHLEASKRQAQHAPGPDGLRGPNAPQAGAPAAERTPKRRSWAHAGRICQLVAAAACRAAPLRACPRRSRPRRSKSNGSASASARHRRLAAAAPGPGRLEGAFQGGLRCFAVAGASA
jgi:hypothetical protein